MRKSEVQACSRHAKGDRSIKETKQKRLKSKAEVVKTGWSGFSWTDKDIVCFGKFSLYPCKRATLCCLKIQRSWLIDISSNRIYTIYSNPSFCPNFLYFLFFLQLDLVATTTTTSDHHVFSLSSVQTSLDRRECFLINGDSAPNCCRDR
jgi:hypothetical protein